jgi:hypothetical protein
MRYLSLSSLSLFAFLSLSTAGYSSQTSTDTDDALSHDNVSLNKPSAAVVNSRSVGSFSIPEDSPSSSSSSLSTRPPESSLFSRLPNEIILEIVTSLSDVPTLLSLSYTDKLLHDIVEQHSSLSSIREFYYAIKVARPRPIHRQYPWRKNIDSNDSFNIKAFSTGFRYIILGTGHPDYDSVLHPTKQAIRSYLNKAVRRFPNRLKEDYPDRFKPILPSNLIRFHYPTVFRLFLQQQRYENDTLSLLYSYLKVLKTYRNKESLQEEDYTEILHGKYSSAGLIKIARGYNTSESDGTYEGLFNDIGMLTKYILFKKDALYPLLSRLSRSTGMYTRDFIQRYPLNYATYKKEIPVLFDKVEKELLEIADKQWRILQELNAYLSIE